MSPHTVCRRTSPHWRVGVDLLATLVLGTGLLVACGGGGSDDDGGDGFDRFYMRANINGQTVEYRQFAVAALYPYRGKADGLLTAGATQGSQTYPSMGIQLIDPNGIKSTTYQESEFGPSFRYSPKENEHYISGVGREMDFKVTITGISDGILKGTFSGTIHDEASEGRRVTWKVTNGAFALEIRRP